MLLKFSSIRFFILIANSLGLDYFFDKIKQILLEKSESIWSGGSSKVICCLFKSSFKFNSFLFFSIKSIIKFIFIKNIHFIFLYNSIAYLSVIPAIKSHTILFLDFLFKFLVRKNFFGFLFTYRNNFLIIFFP